MKHSKQTLESLLKMLDEICVEPENKWFLSELQKKFTKSETELEVNSSLELFQRVFGRKFKHMGNLHYQKINDKVLLMELSGNYKKMRLAYLMGDYVEYGRRIIIQLEGIFNYLVSKLNTYEIIKQKKALGKNEEIIKTSSNTFYDINLYDSFFDEKGNEKPLSMVAFRSKAAFCLSYYKLDLAKNWMTFDYAYSLRNFDSHANGDDQFKAKINRIVSELPSGIGFYEKMFAEYSSCVIKFFEQKTNTSNCLSV